ncbi:hypothetical protein ACLOJK_000845 [Asimina triloba]
MEEKKATPPPDYDLNAKWDACLDLSLRRFVYSSLAGAFGGLLLFMASLDSKVIRHMCSFSVLLKSGSPVTRWASVAFGAGVGLGTAYTECSYKFDVSPSMRIHPETAIPEASSQDPTLLMEQ